MAARIERLVYACSDPKGGGAGSVFDVTNSALLNHKMRVDKGVLQDEAAAMLTAFFKAKRGGGPEFLPGPTYGKVAELVDRARLESE